MNRFAVSAFCLAMGLAVVSGHAEPNSNFPAFKAGIYTLDPMKSQGSFTVPAAGLMNLTGTFLNMTGVLDLRPDDPAASQFRANIPVASVSTDPSVFTGRLMGEDWLDATRYPDIVFVSNRVVPLASDQFQIIGDLTLHGITRPITLTVSLVDSGTDALSRRATLRFKSRGVLKRSEFGLVSDSLLIGEDAQLEIVGIFERRN